ncbi:MAG TPA: hypothetical protein VNO79_14195 [Actinomycetota bacterium]|nr:hypothetical protein [Actinomycetota bacterium]
MDCPCCGGRTVRATELPEIRGWLRPGDRYCRRCAWAFPRELVFEGPEVGRAECPAHGSGLAQPRDPSG